MTRMATVIVHDVDEDALERLRAALAQAGSSVEAEVRAMIKERAGPPEPERRRRAEEAIAALRELRERMYEKHGSTINLTEALRQDRMEW